MVDIPGNGTTTATIALGGSVSDTLEVAGDSDWFRITLTAGQQISVFANGLTLGDPIIRIRDSNGTILYTGDDWGDGLDAFVGFAATYTGTYYIDVASAPNNETGTYELSVTTYTPPPVGTIDDIANQMTHGYWNGDSHHFDVTQGGSITVNLTGIDASGAAVARQALALWTDIIGVTFVEVSTGGQIVFGQANEGTGAFSTSVWSNGITSSATVNVAPSRLNLHTYLHEIAHALGLGHSGDYNGGTAFSRYPYEAMWQSDGAAVSIMSYFDNGENSYYASQGFSNYQVVTPQLADILAMGNLYGLSTTTRTGDTTYGFNNNSGRDVYNAHLNPNVAYTIFDSGGIDTLNYSGFGTNQRINLNSETFSNVGAGVGNVSIARGVVIENAIGGSGNDTLIGNGADNVLTGGPGMNSLTGGAGSDTFRDVAGNLNGDTITDLSAGERIIFTNASLAGFTFSVTGSTLTFTGGSLTLTGGVSGYFVASAAAGGGVQLALAANDAASDFNGDGRSDVLWRNSNGQMVNWLANANGNGGFAENGANSFNWVGTDWSVAGVGDFNGDGRDDILWRSDGGPLVNWLGTASGGFAENGANSFNWVGGDWQVAAVGDFNGDGRDDILWHGSNGQLVDWLGTASGGYAENGANFFTAVATSWQVAGTGDFNGDGRDDILWRNSDGQMVNWLGTASGGFAENGANFFTAVDTAWSIAGVGDFNGDGRDDILWRRNTGQLVDWLANANGGFAENGANFFTAVDTAWSVTAIGDYNRDGRDDILWRSSNGQMVNWLANANGGFAENGGNSFSWVGTDWQVQSSPSLV